MKHNNIRTIRIEVTYYQKIVDKGLTQKYKEELKHKHKITNFLKDVKLQQTHH